MPASSDTIGQLAGALAKAQAELVNPPKSLTAILDAGPGRRNRPIAMPALLRSTTVRKTGPAC
jgi:hypothetical protein